LDVSLVIWPPVVIGLILLSLVAFTLWRIVRVLERLADSRQPDDPDAEPFVWPSDAGGLR
jgi:hypothetical protein